MRKYPFLGRLTRGEDYYVVLFLEYGKGVVVASTIDSIEFGTLGSFDEDKFEFLPSDECVRLSN